MNNFKERLLTEKSELSDRLIKLNDFLESDKVFDIPVIQFDLLKAQHKVMCEYLDILNLRIDIIK